MPAPRPQPPGRLEAVPDGWTLPEGWIADNLGNCRSCQAAVLWCYTPAGRKAPVNRDGTSHFATCPDAPAWRRGPGRATAVRATTDPAPTPTVSRLSRGS